MKIRIFFAITMIVTFCLVATQSHSDEFSEKKQECRQSQGAQDCKTAVSICENALNVNPNDGALYAYIASCYIFKEQYQDAQSWVDKGFTVDNKSKELFFVRGKLLQKDNKTDDAITSFKKSIEIDSKYFPPYMLLSSIFMQQKEHHKVIYYLKKLFEITEEQHITNNILSSNIGLLYDIILSYNEIKEIDEAIKWCAFGIDFNSNNAGLYRIRGTLYSDKNDIEKAISDYKKAITLSQGKPEYYHDLAFLYHKQIAKTQNRDDVNNALNNYKKAYEGYKDGNPDKAIAEQEIKKLSALLVTVSPFDIAFKHGFSSYSELSNFKSELPRNVHSDSDVIKYIDENLFKRVKEFYDDVKMLSKMNFDSSERDAHLMIMEIMSFKKVAVGYFNSREQILIKAQGEESKKQNTLLAEEQACKERFSKLNLSITADKIDPFWFVSQYSFPPDTRNIEGLFSDFARNNYDEIDHDLYLKFKAFTTAINILKNRDFDRSTSEKKDLANGIMSLDSNFSLYLERYENHLSRTERKQKIENERREKGPQQVVAQYRESQKPNSFKEIKELITKLDGWKINVTNNVHTNWKWRISPIQMNNGLRNNIVFSNLPIDASEHKKRYILIKGSIERELDSNYIVTNNAGDEAIADISKKIIKKSQVRFGDTCYMICRLVDVVSVQTLIGITKPVAKLDVDIVITMEEYEKLQKYVLGHPDEFPQQKYVNLY